jgi:hypothetical protein
VKQRWLNEEDAVERMDGWMDEKSTRKSAEEMISCLGEKIALQRKGSEFGLTREREKEPAQGVASLSSHTGTNGSKGTG